MRRWLLPVLLLLSCLAAGLAALAPPRADVPSGGARVARDGAADGRAALLPGGARATVGPDRRVHILDGDARGGGHRPGRGLPNKSEFPRGWSDDAIIEAIEDVANDPASSRRTEADGRTVLTGRRGGVLVRVVVERDGRSIVTGYPIDTPRNPR